jgi:hypothetical protein
VQIIRGTRVPFLAAACAMLILGASAADSPVIELVTAQAYISLAPPVAGGVDGCPALAGSTFDPRMLCATDLGVGWTPSYATFVQLCPLSPFTEGAVLATGTSTVIERIFSDADLASAVADVHARVSCALGPISKAFGTNRELRGIVIPGTTAEAQVIADLSYGGVEIMTIAAIGPAVLEVGVAQDAGRPDNPTVTRIVNSAVQRFQNPRPSGGPFPPVTTTTFVDPSAPSS